MLSRVKKLSPGRYVVAVSGGVDSMVLLDILSKNSELEIIVAHYNHGNRKSNSKDEKLVVAAAVKQNLEVRVGRGNLGMHPSEDEARKKRYDFLLKVQKSMKAKSVVTAHHRDDLVETAFLNIIRGTGRKGLSAIINNPNIQRPLMAVSKDDIRKYAKKNKILWNEDPTNSDETYLRNYLRANILPNLTEAERIRIANNLQKVAKTNNLIEREVATMSHKLGSASRFDRQKFTSLPVELGNELIAYWLRSINRYEFDKKTINRLNLAIRSKKRGTRIEINDGMEIILSEESASIVLNR